MAAAPPVPSSGTAPIAGLRPGLALVGLLLVASNLRAAITSVGPVLGVVQDDQGLSSVAASVLVSVPLLAFAGFSPIAPGIARRLGLERALGLALVLLATGIVLRSTPPRALLWTGTVLLGVAIAIMNVLLPALVKRDFPTRIGAVTGAYSAVQSGTAAIAAGIAVPLAGQEPSGWRLAMGVWAGLALIAVAVCAPLLRRSASAPATGTGAPTPPPLSRMPWSSALAWQVTLFMGLQSFAYYSLIAWLSSIEQGAGISPTTAGFHQLLLNLFGLVGSLSCSALIQRLPDQRVIALGGSGLLVVALTGLLTAPELGALWASLAGLSGGTSLVLALSLFGLRTRDHTSAGALSGMAQGVGYTIAAFGPLTVGALHDGTGSWTTPLSTLIVLAVLQAAAGFLASRPRTVDR